MITLIIAKKKNKLDSPIMGKKGGKPTALLEEADKELLG